MSSSSQEQHTTILSPPPGCTWLRCSEDTIRRGRSGVFPSGVKQLVACLEREWKDVLLASMHAYGSTTLGSFGVLGVPKMSEGTHLMQEPGPSPPLAWTCSQSRMYTLHTRTNTRGPLHSGN